MGIPAGAAGPVGAGILAARATTRFVPFAAFGVRGGVAYGGTRAIGEAARRYFAAK